MLGSVDPMMLMHIQVLVGQGLCRLYIDLTRVGHLFRFLLMTPRVCCAFLATELHCAVQFNVFDICTQR